MRIARRRSSNPEISLVSTSDVAFLLLIFFLSTAALSVERGLLLELPRAGDAPAAVPASRILTLEIDAEGSFSFDGRLTAADGIRPALAARLRAVPTTVVRLLVHARAPYHAFVTALDQVKLAGARQVSLEPGGGA